MELMIHVFHGFLGSPKDFDFLPTDRARTYDLYHFDRDSFLKELQVEDVIMGYSMGGRLAMELAVASNFQLKKLVLINAHPGLSDRSSLPERQIWEESVMERLNTLSQEEFLEYWNKLPLFKADQPLKPMPQARFTSSAELFTNHRLSQQKNYVPLLAQHKHKVLWIAGQQDEKYAQVARDLIVPQGIETEFIDGGHRLYQHPNSLVNILKAHNLL